MGRTIPVKQVIEEKRDESKPVVIFKPSIAKKEAISQPLPSIQSLAHAMPKTNATKTPDLILYVDTAHQEKETPKKNTAHDLLDSNSFKPKADADEWSQTPINSLPHAQIKLGKKKTDTKKNDTLDLGSFDRNQFRPQPVVVSRKEDTQKNQSKYDVFDSLDNNLI